MRYARLFQLGAAMLWAFACHADVRSTDGNTSWVSMCKTSADCSRRMACECGVCTSVCAMDAVCGGAQSACAKAGTPAFTATCGEASTLAGVCLPRCPEEGCGAGRICNRGLCTLSPVAEPPLDAGPTRDAAGGTGGLGPEPADSAAEESMGPLATCNSFDDPRYPNGPIISFRNDILPMFGLSCVVSDCHSPRDHKAGLSLGYKCVYDPNAKWKCTFPATPDLDTTKPQPDDEQTVADIYASLLAPSLTVNGGLVKRVVPGDPANSFLVLKLADQQTTRGYPCTNPDISHESNPPPCGVAMPQNQDSYCTGAFQPRFDAVVRWIAQGARNN